MVTTIDSGSDYENPVATIFRRMNDYGKEAGDYQTTMPEKSAGDYRLCPLREVATSIRMAAGGVPMESAIYCDGPRCAWYDQTAERCAVLSLARNK